jgi:hypothetical protein
MPVDRKGGSTYIRAITVGVVLATHHEAIVLGVHTDILIIC